MNDLKRHSTLYLIPEEVLDELIAAVKSIKKFQENLEKEEKNIRPLGDYIDEDHAMELLKRGKTWFWNKRKSGELPGKKAAGRWYYNIADIKTYIQNDGNV